MKLNCFAANMMIDKITMIAMKFDCLCVLFWVAEMLAWMSSTQRVNRLSNDVDANASILMFV